MRVGLVYNRHLPSLYDAMGESAAESGVMEAVRAVRRALRALGHDFTEVPLSPPLERVGETLAGIQADVIFNLFEGFAGLPMTEAAVADILEDLKLPFTGSPAAALALTLDKPAAIQALRARGVRTPNYQLLDMDNLDSFNLGFPCIVKPRADDASHSLSERSVVFDRDALSHEVRTMVERYDGAPALVEAFLGGREFNATVWGVKNPQVLPLSEIMYSLPDGLPKILTFAAKWEPHSMYFKHTAVKCPAEVTKELGAEIREAAMAAFLAAGCRGYGRVDMRLDRDGHPVVMEINANPDIAPGTGVARQAKAAGYSYKGMVEAIINFGLESS